LKTFSKSPVNTQNGEIIMKLKIHGTIRQSTVDGLGIRYAIFCQGCPHHCKGCHNPETWNFQNGFYVDTDDLLKEIQKDPLLDGVTFSGGEPFLQEKPLSDLADKIHQLGLNVWCYTGFTYEQIKDSELIKHIDVLVDGPYIQELRTLTGFRGSSNQRVIKLFPMSPKTQT